MQRRDPELGEIIDFLENDVLPLNEKSARRLLLTSETFYIGKGGLLYHLDQNRKRNNHDAFSQLVIPQALKFEVLSNVHDHVSGGLVCTKPFRRLNRDIGGRACLKMSNIGANRARIVQ